ncbi:FCD domain-containing protein [Arthrobacter cryoconiti]
MTFEAEPLSELSAMDDAVLAGLDRRSAIDAVRVRIGTAILLGLMKPGERLPDKDDVALGLSVSPITARRALTSLAEEGVVVRRRGRNGGTFVADCPPKDVLTSLAAPMDQFGHVHRLVDRRMLGECAVTHFATLNISADQLDRLHELTVAMDAASSWSVYHQLDEQFHRLVAQSSALSAAVDAYLETLMELYEYFIPYPIESLHGSNQDHISLVRALREGRTEAAVEISRQHVDTLHRTMFMALSDGTAQA